MCKQGLDFDNTRGTIYKVVFLNERLHKKPEIGHNFATKTHNDVKIALHLEFV